MPRTLRTQPDRRPTLRIPALHRLFVDYDSPLALLDSNTPLESIVNIAAETLAADPVLLYPYEPRVANFRLPPILSGKLLFPDALPRCGHLQSSSLLRLLITRGELFYAARPQKWSDVVPLIPSFSLRERIISCAALPLIAHGNPLGLLLVNYRHHRALTPALRYTLELLGGFATNALHNTRSLRAVKRSVDALAALDAIGRTLTSASSFTIENVLQAIHTHLSSFTDTRNFYVALLEPDTRLVTFPFVIHEGARRNPPDEEWAPRPFGNGLTEYVFTTNAPLHLAGNVLSWLAERGVQSIGRHAEAWLGVPLIARGQTLGVMAVQSYTSPTAFDPDDVPFWSAVGAQVGIALSNAQLILSLEAKIRHQVSLYNRFRLLAHQAVGLLNAPTVAELAKKFVALAAATLNAQAALYLHSAVSPGCLDLEVADPLAFRNDLEPTCLQNQSPLCLDHQQPSEPFMYAEARNQDGGLEGLLCLRRVGHSQRLAEPFSDSDRHCHSLFAAAIAEGLHNLHIVHSLGVASAVANIRTLP